MLPLPDLRHSYFALGPTNVAGPAPNTSEISIVESGWVLEISPPRIIPGLAAFHIGSQASLGEPEGILGLFPSALPGDREPASPE